MVEKNVKEVLIFFFYDFMMPKKTDSPLYIVNVLSLSHGLTLTHFSLSLEP